jgi:DEAD/DEAH box helicase domain-containing protein
MNPTAPLASLLASVTATLAAHRFTVTDTVLEPAREPVLLPVPRQLAAEARAAVEAAHPAGIYRHQAVALEALHAGEDVVLTTSTASGKSLVFRAAAIDALARDPKARVLALFPTRALAQDQAAGWARFGVSAALIDGGIPVAQRAGILAHHRVILSTPDVAHTWLLGAQAPENRSFLDHLALLVLDEAHTYDGVFGTNMAYFLRRLTAAAPRHRLVAASATLERAEDFLCRLTGRTVREVGADVDGTGSPGRAIVRVTHPEGRRSRASLVGALATLEDGGRPLSFLAFVDGRQEADRLARPAAGVHAYRAGFEQADRTEIQNALASRACRGVVSTCALEVGVDIGALDVVALLGAPYGAKALRQRVGRCGRARPGVCVVLDDRNVVSAVDGGFAAWLARPVESNALYLDNRFVQYAHAICAARELGASGVGAAPASQNAAFSTLPAAFRALLSNELDPREPVSDELYPLKQRAESNSPHHEFPLRTGGAQPSWSISFRGERIGTLSHGQMLREAYPGAMYSHRGCPYRIARINARDCTIEAVAAYNAQPTRPLWQSVAFPTFDGAYGLRRGAGGFVAEVPVQVHERVVGFQDVGRAGGAHAYGPGSTYHQRMLTSSLSTTGVCWYVEHIPGAQEATLGRRVLEAFRAAHGIHGGDVQVSPFIAKATPLGQEVRGLIVYDTTPGSLRLTAQLFASFDDVIARAMDTARDEAEAGDAEAQAVLPALAALVEALAAVREVPVAAPDDAVFADTEFLEMVTPGETALLIDKDGSASEAIVQGFRFSPQGVVYDLVSETPGVRRTVGRERVRPRGNLTRTVRWNPATDERLPA